MSNTVPLSSVKGPGEKQKVRSTNGYTDHCVTVVTVGFRGVVVFKPRGRLIRIR